MGAEILTTNPADFAIRQQIFFSRQLMEAIQYRLRLGVYGEQKEVPANSGVASIRFFRPRRAKKGTANTGPRPLVEGVPIAQNTTVPIGYVDCKLFQRGDSVSISDIVRAVDLFNTGEVYSKTMGDDAALDFDFVCSRSICARPGVADSDGQASTVPVGQTTMYGSNSNFERFAGVVNTGNSANDWASMMALTATQGSMTRAVALGAITRLKGINGTPGVPMINGKYVAHVPPEVLADMRQDAVWQATAIYNNAKGSGIDLTRWVEFDLDGVSYVENQSPFIESTVNPSGGGGGGYGIYSPDATAIVQNNSYACLFLGKGAFGVPKLAGMRAGSDPYAPSMIVLDKPDKSDPANQETVYSWKAYYNSILLWTNEATDVPHLVVQRCRTKFV